MSDKKKPLWVSPQAHAHVADLAEQDGIGMFEAANRLVLSATPVKRAVSSGDAARLTAQIEILTARSAAAEVEIERMKAAVPPNVLADPRVIKFAADKKITPAAAVEWMIDRASRRAVNLATYAEKKRAAR